MNKKEKKIYFLPLGGSGEIGMNLNLYGYGDDWIIVDCGVSFRDSETPGADVFMPDISAIEKNRLNIKGMIITHAHEDHIGAVHYLWPFIKCPVYTTPFSAYLLKQRLVEAGLEEKVKLITIQTQSKFNIASFNIEFINISHSILEPNALLIKAGESRILHTGDWKIDDNTNIGTKTDEKRLREIGNEGVLAIICDSTNAKVEGYSGSEGSLKKGLKKAISNCKGMVFVASFASNLERVVSVANIGKELNRNIGLIGRSMWRMTDAAKAVGYITNDINFYKEKELSKLKRSESLAICTGSQGEPLGALSRIIDDNHRFFSFNKGDRVVFSSRIIPGNEKVINKLINKLIHRGVEVIIPKNNDIHVSGHPAEEELKIMYNWIKPKIALPVHGEAMHIQAHANLAKKMQVPEVLEPQNGFLIQLYPGKAKVIKKTETGKMAVDGKSIISTDSKVFSYRKKMLFNGVILITILVDSTGGLYRYPRAVFTGVKEELKKEDIRNFEAFVNELVENFIPFLEKNDNDLCLSIKKKSKKYTIAKFSKDPLVEVDILRL